MSEHTPGPWTVGSGYEQSDPGWYVFAADGQVVCASQDETDCPLTEPDARLIAAAPKMLDSLKIVANYLWERDGDRAKCNPVRSIIVETVAKAEGRTP